MKKGLAITAFILGIAITLCGAATTIIGAIGMGQEEKLY